MNNPALKLEQDVLYVSGPLLLKQAAVLLQQLSHFKRDTIKTVDFSQANECDSTGILLMLNVQRYAKQKINFKNIPHRLKALLALSDLIKELAITE